MLSTAQGTQEEDEQQYLSIHHPSITIIIYLLNIWIHIRENPTNGFKSVVFGCVMLKTSNIALLYEKPEQTTQTVRDFSHFQCLIL